MTATMTNYDTHEAADIFPTMDSARFAELVADIRANGLIHPIVLCDGKVLDGRNRYRACLEAKAEPKFINFVGNPFDYAWSVNGQRRDLSGEQRAAIWLEAAERSHAWRAEQERIARTADEKRAEAANERHRDEKGRLKSSGATTCGSTGSDKSAKASTSAAKASGTNRGAIERQQMLRAKRPDLAAKVRLGEIKANEAKWQMKRDAVMEKALTSPPSGKYRVIYADPPWKYDAELISLGSTARDYYPTMPLSEICALPISDMAENDAVLFLWVTAPMAEKAFQVASAWGFEYKEQFVWYKGKHNMGRYNSVRHELLYICTRGSCQPDVRKLYKSVQCIARTEHSRKPEKFRQIIDAIYPYGSRIELFQRGDCVPKHWHVWGAESSSDGNETAAAPFQMAA